MGNAISQLLTNPVYSKIIQEKLPPAFQTVECELKGNPAVGLLREQVILGMLIAFLGEDKIKLVDSGVNPDIDCYCDSEPLSIKTVSGSGGIRMKWTSNAVKAKQFMDSHKPTGNLLIVRIIWDEYGSMRFIPLDVQQDTFNRLGIKQYLDYRGSTNTRGVNLSPKAEQAINSHSNCVSLPILWSRSKSVVNPIDKWTDYWRKQFIT